jgi:hypothetical protein
MVVPVIAHHKSGISDRRLRVGHPQENGHLGLDLVDVCHAGPVKLWDPGAVVEIDQEAVDAAVVGIDGDVPRKVLAARPALALKLRALASCDIINFCFLIIFVMREACCRLATSLRRLSKDDKSFQHFPRPHDACTKRRLVP